MSDTTETVAAVDIAPAAMPAPTAPTPAVDTAAPALDSAKVDRAGAVFNPARHIDRQNRITGRWMPRGGRKAKVPASGAGTPAAPAAAASTVPDPPPAPSFIPKVLPPPATVEDFPVQTTAAAGADNSEDAAECAARALQFTAGAVFNAHKDCTPPPDEHKSMVRSFAAYIRAQGWQATAGVSALIVVAAWLLRVLQKDRPAAKLREWFGADKADAAIDVTPGNPAPAKKPVPAAPPAARSVHDLIPTDENFQ